MGIRGAGMEDKDANINVIRSVWRRTKKGHVKVRDLQPEKDVKGGAGGAGIIRTSSSIAETPSETKAHAERIAKAQRLFLRWLKKGKK
jgi:hypothetical protein